MYTLGISYVIYLNAGFNICSARFRFHLDSTTWNPPTKRPVFQFTGGIYKFQVFSKRFLWGKPHNPTQSMSHLWSFRHFSPGKISLLFQLVPLAELDLDWARQAQMNYPRVSDSASWWEIMETTKKSLKISPKNVISPQLHSFHQGFLLLVSKKTDSPRGWSDAACLLGWDFRSLLLGWSVGDWTYPFEKYARHIGSWNPKVRGKKLKKNETT